MSHKSILMALAALLLSSMSWAAELTWYGADGAVTLVIDSSKVAVKLENGFSNEDVLLPLDRVVTLVGDVPFINGFVVCSLSTVENYSVFLDSLSALSGVYMVEPFYVSEHGSPQLVGDEFCVAFHDQVSYEEIDSINAAFKVVIDRERIGRKKAFTLRNTDSSGYRTVEIANIFHDLPQVEYAHPDFVVEIEKNGYGLYDYYNEYQPHLKKIIGEFNVATVWDFAGVDRAITVALLDDGVDSHEDLPAARMLPGYDFVGSYYSYQPDDDPRPGDSCGHGMAMAGIIAASHTTDPAYWKFKETGIISMDPHVNIMPIKVFADQPGYGFWACRKRVSIQPSRLADAVDYAWTEGADILCCTWTYPSAYEPDYEVLNNALQRATVFGRGGLGCPVIFPTGNNFGLYPWVRYPARLPYCFAVGATFLNDSLLDESCWGPFYEVDVVAPSDNGSTGWVWGLDRMGDLGFNPVYMTDCPSPGANNPNYDCYMWLTSPACALAAGTAALVMAKDSTLNFEGYYYILRNSAVKDLDWYGPMPDTPNVGYGYGRLDAFRAILSISRGNVDNVIGPGGEIDVADVTYLVAYVFQSGAAPFPDRLLGDCDCDGDVNVADVTYLVAHVFQGGPHPVRPCFKY
ncbi:MAG: S8 family serine peptidase [Candidatus Zixiibacteriota bacterium]